MRGQKSILERSTKYVRKSRWLADVLFTSNVRLNSAVSFVTPCLSLHVFHSLQYVFLLFRLWQFVRHFFCWFNLLASGSCTSSLHFNSSIPFVTSFLSFRLFCSSLRLLHFVRCCCRFKSSIPFVTSSFPFNSSMLRVGVRPEAYTSSWDEWTWPLDNHCVDLI